ncbi:MAG TPA: hypothetical protein DCM87_02080 [Planctomycetes bacterium]|nr:hypothetical protein [Planctomycetota bacterium]
MKLLLDTHVWIWSQETPDALGPRTRAALRSAANDLHVSSISTVEIARLIALDRLRIAMDLGAWVDESLRLLGARTVPITHEIAIEAYRLPEPFHRDPADRLLVAAARLLGLRLVTADAAILRYRRVQTTDARK